MSRPAVRRIAAGTILTASWLNRIVDNVNELTQAFRPARQTNLGTLPIIDDDGNVNISSSTVATVWTETARITSIVRVENPDDPNQWVDFERIEAVSFSTPEGEVQLLFRNVDNSNGD